MKKLLILVVTSSLVLGACSPSETNTENGSESSSVGVSDARKLPLQNKILAIGNNVRKMGASCTTGAAVAGLGVFAEIIPVLNIGVKMAAGDAASDHVDAIIENATQEAKGNMEQRIKEAVFGGAAYAAIVDLVGNILNLIKMITIKGYTPPRWNQSWDRLQIAYSGTAGTIENMMAGENAVCRDSFRSAKNVITSMFPKKK